MIRSTLLALALATSGAAAAAAAGSAQTTAASQQVSTQEYVQMAAISDMFEVQSSKLALEKSSSNAVQDFASMMVEDHTKSTQKLMQAVQASDVKAKPPTELDAEHMKMIQQLQAASGEQFDRLYLDMQVKGHQKAVQLHQAYSQSGEDPKLQAVAKELVPIIQAHLTKVKKLADGTTSS